MDGDPVEGEPSKAYHKPGGSDGGETVAAPASFTELFMELCPKYMAMGMTYDEFWHRNTCCHRAYRKAFEERRSYDNWKMWMQGAYIYDALLKVSPMMRASFGKGKAPEPGKYPDMPYPITAKEAKEQAEIAQKKNFERMLAVFEHESKNNIKNKES